jgi:hypothetical protein
MPPSRALLDKQYGDKPWATTTSDRVLMGFTVVVAGLLLWRGVQAVSFLGGLWIGATLIQLYGPRCIRLRRCGVGCLLLPRARTTSPTLALLLDSEGEPLCPRSTWPQSCAT